MRWLPAAGVLTMIGLAAAAASLTSPGALTSALAAPLYYLLPLGVGLLLTQPLAGGLTRTQRALCAYLTGLVAICALLVAREHLLPARLSLDLCAGAIAVASLAGIALGGNFFRWDGAARRAALEYAVVLPVFAVAYLLRFAVFSDYPATDLFQATHLMKAALDFGRFDMLNPFTAGSYPPVIPVVEGLLFRYLGFEPLHGVWVLSALSTLPKFLALRAAVQPALATRAERVFAVAAAACFLSAFTPTNGELAMLGSLAVFSLVLHASREPGPPRHAACAVLAVAAFVAAYLAARAAPLVYLATLGLACALPMAAARLRQPAVVLAVVPLVVAVIPLHRSAMLFIPLALGCASLLSLLRRWRGWTLGAGRKLVIATAALTAVTGLATLGLLGWFLTHPAQDLRELDAYRWIVATVLRSTFDDNPEIVLGSGPKVALFELGRAMSPSFVAFAIGLTTYVALRALWGAGTAPGYAAARETRDAVVAWTLAVALGCGLLLGIPFAYRSGFLIIVLLAIALAAAGAVAARDERATRIDLAVLALAGGYSLAVIPLAYRCAPLVSCERSAYSELARPLLAALSVLALAAVLGGILGHRHAPARRMLVRVALVLVFALEFAVSKTYFFPYAYGVRPASSGTVSHLSKAEIELAKRIRGLGGNVILVSDPATMANLRALTGLNSVITFSNLDTLSPSALARYKSWFRALLESEERRVCSGQRLLAALGGALSSAEFNYWLARLSRPGESGAEILHGFGYRNSLVLTAEVSAARSSLETIDRLWYAGALRNAAKLAGSPLYLVVVNRKTVEWARGDATAGYYPDVGSLDPGLVERLRLRCDAQMHDGRFLLIPFPAAGDGEGKDSP